MLKHLEISGTHFPSRDGLKYCALKIDSPSLATFHYTVYSAKKYVLSSFPTPMEAVVCIDSIDNGVDISPLLRALTHVKCLTVNDLILQAMCSVCDQSNNLLAFHNVKTLRISKNLTTDEGLIALLKAVPKLDSLEFYEYMYDEVKYISDVEDDDSEDDDANSVESKNNDENEGEGDVSYTAECDNNDESEGNYDNEDDSWALDIGTTECLFPHLKSVCFQEFAGNPREMKWVKLILRDAKVLEMMTICHFDCDDKFYPPFVNARSEKQVTVEIPSYPRASPGCVIKFCC